MTTIDCATLQERMPDVAAGTSAWSASETEHLASCGECALEWRLIQAARAHGDQIVAAIDPAAMATRVLAGLRPARARRGWQRSAWIGGLAAAAVLVLVLRIALPVAPVDSVIDSVALATATAAPLGRTIPMAELDALDAEELEAVLEQLDGTAAAASGGDVPAIGDLDDHQLERVLRSLEG